MKRFSALFTELDSTTATSAKVVAMTRYLAEAPPQDAAWAVYLLAGGKPRQVIRTAQLRALACEVAGIEDWLFEACYQAVGDLAETIAHVLPDGDGRGATAGDVGLAAWMEKRLLPLRGAGEPEVAAQVRGWWRELDPQVRFLLVKLVGGGFRVGVSKLLVQRALAAHAGVDVKQIAERMMGYTDAKQVPSASKFIAITQGRPWTDGLFEQNGQPYPFFLAHALDTALHATPEALTERLGPVADWLAEWKFDGIRGQVVRRGGSVWIWSRGEELVTERFPEIVALAQSLPDGTVLDGEILVWACAPDADGRPAPFARLQQRIGRKTLTQKVLTDAPVTFMAYDLLEARGVDLRAQPQHGRRTALEALLAGTAIRLSPTVAGASWDALAALRAESRSRGVEGLMLKHRTAAYGAGRTKADGVWWKWKIDPMTIDCVLVYAQAGHGRRASVYTDYTFAVWNRPPVDAAEAEAVLQAIASKQPVNQPAPSVAGPPPDASAPSGGSAVHEVTSVGAKLQLVAFAKAYSGLTDAEFKQVDAVIRKTTLEKFGPVRSVRPSLVFELGFEGINRSPRHKSGIAVRFPRMLRIRADKPLHEANSLAELELLLNI
jgi:DNA ligase 1